MDYMQLSIEDREKLKNCIRQEFIFFVKPSNVLPYISKCNYDVLTPADKSKLLAITNTRGDHDGAVQLLEDLSRYKGWLKCLMDVLRDPQVKLGHAAEIMERRIVDAQLGHVLHSDSGVKSTEERGLGGPQLTAPRHVHCDEHPNLLDGAVANVPDNCAQSGETSTMTTPLNIDILLIGKTGTGKSATGNSILGRKAFVTSCGPCSETRSFCCEYTEINGRPIKVVDGISLFGTDSREDSNLKFAINSLQEAIAVNPEGYHAFCIVVRFGCRFTQEDHQTIQLLKGVFGEEFVKNFCILLLTNGESFDLEAAYESGLTDFTDWYYKQTGVFKHVVDECNGRVILFRNKTRDPAVINDQRDQLIKMIDDMCVQRLRYGR